MRIWNFTKIRQKNPIRLEIDEVEAELVLASLMAYRNYQILQRDLDSPTPLPVRNELIIKTQEMIDNVNEALK